jgi:hypothetical protein
MEIKGGLLDGDHALVTVNSICATVSARTEDSDDPLKIWNLGFFIVQKHPYFGYYR